jgi:hypothetical protein
VRRAATLKTLCIMRDQMLPPQPVRSEQEIERRADKDVSRGAAPIQLQCRDPGPVRVERRPIKSINADIVLEGELGYIGSGSEIHDTVPELEGVFY